MNKECRVLKASDGTSSFITPCSALEIHGLRVYYNIAQRLETMSPNHAIPWYRIHIVSCVLMMIVGAAMLWIQTIYNSGEVLRSRAYLGWPLAYEENSIFLASIGTNWFAVLANLLSGALLMTGTGFLSELLIRRLKSRFQFSLTATLVVIFALAVLMGERYAGWNMYALAKRLYLQPTLLSSYPWYLAMPIFFAIFCTLCSAGALFSSFLSRWMRRYDDAPGD